MKKTKQIVGSDQSCGSAFISSGSSILGWIPIRIQGFNDKNQIFFDQKLQFTYPQASIKYVQVTEEAFSSQKRPSNTSKNELLKIRIGSGFRIRIQSGSATLVPTEFRLFRVTENSRNSVPYSFR